MGANHVRVLSNIEGVELVAVVDPGKAELPGYEHLLVADLENERLLVADLDSALARGIDYAVVAVPTVLHAQVSHALASAGVHALIEKPLAQDSVTARELAEAFTRAGLVAGVGHIERFNPALRSMRERLQAHELGEVYQIATRRQGPFPSRIADTGVVMDLATHDLDLTAWVASSEYASIDAFTGTARLSDHIHEDFVTAIGQLHSGVVTSHIVNWLSPMKERVTIVTGERGALVADTLTADLTFHENGKLSPGWHAIPNFRGVSEGNMIRYAMPKPEPLQVEHEAFRDAVLGRPTMITTLAEAVRAVEVAEAVLDAAARGRRVRLSPG